MKDPYVYEKTSILKNINDIRNQKELDDYENAMVSLEIIKLHKENYEVKCLNDIFDIHKILFSNIYEWAGKARTINIYKEEPVLNGLSVDYSDYKKIKSDLNKLDKEFSKLDFNNMSKKELVKNVSYYFTMLWKIHPFREGNTRSVSTLMSLFAKKIGLKLNIDFVSNHAKYFRNAMVLNSIGEYSEPEHLEEFLSDALMFKNINNTNIKYQTIKGYELDKYQYRQHKYKD